MNSTDFEWIRCAGCCPGPTGRFANAQGLPNAALPDRAFRRALRQADADSGGVARSGRRGKQSQSEHLDAAASARRASFGAPLLVTEPGRGYRFVARVKTALEGADAPEQIAAAGVALDAETTCARRYRLSSTTLKRSPRLLHCRGSRRSSSKRRGTDGSATSSRGRSLRQSGCSRWAATS